MIYGFAYKIFPCASDIRILRNRHNLKIQQRAALELIIILWIKCSFVQFILMCVYVQHWAHIDGYYTNQLNSFHF